MKRAFLGFLLLVTVLGFYGCQTAPKPKTSQEDTISALSTMTQGLTNQPITQAQLKSLGVQLAHDPQARCQVGSTHFPIFLQVRRCIMPSIVISL